MGLLNTTYDFQAWMYDREKSAPERENIKALPEKKQILFKALCMAQGTIYYENLLKETLEALRIHNKNLK